MNIEIIEERKNEALGNRKEITFVASYEGGTAAKEELKVELCKKLNLAPEGTMIVRMEQQYGRHECKGIAHSYEKEEDMKRIEPKHLLKRMEKKAAPDAEEGK